MSIEHEGRLQTLEKKAEMKCPNKNILVRGRQPWVMVAVQPSLEVQIAICDQFQLDFI